MSENPDPKSDPRQRQLRDVVAIERLCDELERAIRNGSDASIETLLQNCAEPLKPNALKAMLIREIEIRQEIGEALNVVDLIQRFPSQKELIQKQSAATSDSNREPLATNSVAMPSTSALTPEQMCELAQKWTNLADRKSAIQEAKALVRAGRLSKFQAEEILNGRVRHLTFGPYIVIDKIGQGGMGMVLRAEHRQMKRKVAIKVLPRTDRTRADAGQRFIREVEAAARLTHPNIVTAFDAGEHENMLYLVMELVQGADLHNFVQQHGPMNVPDAVHCVLEAARGLEYAHLQSVIHRDIKPANLLLATGPAALSASGSGTLEETVRVPDIQRCRVKVLDMGLARFKDADMEPKGKGVAPAGVPLTQTGHIMGTVDYMSPEQAVDTRNVDGRADIYALGCTLHYLLTGDPPYSGDSMVRRLMAHKMSPPPSLCEKCSGVPESLDLLFQSMLAKDAADRISSMEEVITALEACQLEIRSDSHRAGSGLKNAPKKPVDLGPVTDSRRATSFAKDQTLPIDEVPERSSVGKIIKGLVAAIFLGLVVVLGIVANNRGSRPDGTTSTIIPPGAAKHSVTKSAINQEATSAHTDTAKAITPPRPWSDTDAAEWAINNGGSVRILISGSPDGTLLNEIVPQVVELRRADPVPQTEFRISAMDLTRIKGDIDGNVVRLSGLSELSELNLDGTELTDAGIVSLSQMRSLKSLNVRGCQIGAAGYKAIGQMSGLITLSVGDLPSTEAMASPIKIVGLKDSDLGELSRLKELQKLTIGGSTVAETSVLRMIDYCPRLVALECVSVQFTDIGLGALTRLQHLRTLSLMNAGLTDSAVDGLTALRNLTQLNVQGNSISRDGIRRLETSLNNCTIFGGGYDPQRNRIRQIVEVNGSVIVSPVGEESRRIDKRSFNDLPQEFSIRAADLSSVRPLPPHLLDLNAVTELNLADSAISVQSIRQLPGLTPAVTILNLSGTSVTDAEITILASMSSLQELDVSRTRVTAERVAAFKQERPDCHIIGP